MSEEQAPNHPTPEEAPPEHDEFGTDQKRMPFMAHLIELRWRVLISVIVLGLLFVVFFFGFSATIFRVMILPVKRAFEYTGGEEKYGPWKELLRARKPMEMFVSAAYFCLLAALIVAAPIIIYELWSFVAPGLKRRERRAVVRVVGFGSILFAGGAAFAYFVTLPVMLGFFLEYTAGFGVSSQWNVGDAMDFEAMIILIFGVAFEMPLVVVALTYVGILSPDVLARKRRHAIVAIVLFAGIVTPTPDPFSQMCLAVPLYILYEIGLQIAKRVKRKGTVWDRWFGPIPPETPEHAPDAAPAPAYDEGSAYPPEATGQTEAPYSVPAYTEGGVPIAEQPETQPPGSQAPPEGDAPTHPGQPASGEDRREPEMGTDVEDQRSTRGEGEPPATTEGDGDIAPMH